MKTTAKIILTVCLVAIACSAALACGGKSTVTWGGLDDITVIAGDRTDLMQGVTATDSSGVDVSGDAVILNSAEHEDELTALGVIDDFEDFNYNVPGTYTVYYRVAAAGKNHTATRNVTVIKGHNVINGDFSMTNAAGFYNWSVDHPGGNVTLEKYSDSDGKTKPKFVIDGIGNAWYGLQFINSVNLEKDQAYRISVTARSSTGKSVAFGFEDVSNNYAMLQGLTVHKLTDESKTYHSYYTADKLYVNAKAVLYMGKMLPSDVLAEGSHEVIIDKISIEKLSVIPGVEFTGLDDIVTKDGGSLDLAEGVAAKRGNDDLTDKIEIIGEVPARVTEAAPHAVLYAVTDENGATAYGVRSVRVEVNKDVEYDLINGDFSQGLDGWTQDVVANTAAKAEYTTDADGAKITVVSPSDAAWHIQLSQQIRLTKGTKYTLNVRAKASVEREAILELGGSTQYTLSLTTQWQDFSFEYTHEGESGDVKYSFLMGGGGADNNGSVINIESASVTLSK